MYLVFTSMPREITVGDSSICVPCLFSSIISLCLLIINCVSRLLHFLQMTYFSGIWVSSFLGSVDDVDVLA